MGRYVTEFIGTFFLVLVIGLAVKGGADEMAPLAIGLSLMVMVYLGGHVSGAHYNPAVTVAVFLRGRLPARDIVPYMVAQIAGAFAAAALVKLILNAVFPCAPSTEAIAAHAVLIEFLFTFALALVVLNAATAKKTANNSFYGLAIGMTLTAAVYAGGGISGGAFNPAVGIGPILVSQINGTGGMQHLWIYLVGPLAGGVLAALVFKLQNPGDA